MLPVAKGHLGSVRLPHHQWQRHCEWSYSHRRACLWNTFRNPWVNDDVVPWTGCNRPSNQIRECCLQNDLISGYPWLATYLLTIHSEKHVMASFRHLQTQQTGRFLCITPWIGGCLPIVVLGGSPHLEWLVTPIYNICKPSFGPFRTRITPARAFPSPGMILQLVLVVVPQVSLCRRWRMPWHTAPILKFCSIASEAIGPCFVGQPTWRKNVIPLVFFNKPWS